VNLRLLSAAALLALLAGCAPPIAVPPAPAMGLFWQGGGDWSVNRFPLGGAFYCSATRGSFGPDFAFNETQDGVVGWNVTDTTGHAVPGTVYPVTLTFTPGGVLKYTATLQAPTRLASLPADPATTVALTHDIPNAEFVEIKSASLGAFGRFGLTGSAEAMTQLDHCAHGAL
jgi:hypothetical protein